MDKPEIKNKLNNIIETGFLKHKCVRDFDLCRAKKCYTI